MRVLTIAAADGTPINCTASGAGPLLLLVHGSGGSQKQWDNVRPLLEGDFTVVCMDRRGHGASGDAAAYGLDTEAADIAVVLAAFGGGAVVAHSYGALCALLAAMVQPMAGLVLYEPPVVTAPGAYFPPDLVPAMRAAIAQGDGGAAIMAFARIVRGASDAQVAQMSRMPGWADRAARAPVLLRELAAVDAFRADPARFAGFHTPVLLLRGALSGPDYVATADVLHTLLPGSVVAVLDGQGHSAIEGAPARVAEVILGFLKPDTGQA